MWTEDKDIIEPLLKLDGLNEHEESHYLPRQRLPKVYWQNGYIDIIKTKTVINENFATTQELDRAIEDGPGLRYSLMGTFLTFHLAGGKEGMKHMLRQFGPALKLPWTKLKAPRLSKKLSDRIVKGTQSQARGRSVSNLSNIRDDYLVNLQILRNKYIKKIRKKIIPYNRTHNSLNYWLCC